MISFVLNLYLHILMGSTLRPHQLSLIHPACEGETCHPGRVAVAPPGYTPRSLASPYGPGVQQSASGSKGVWGGGNPQGPGGRLGAAWGGLGAQFQLASPCSFVLRKSCTLCVLHSVDLFALQFNKACRLPAPPWGRGRSPFRL